MVDIARYDDISIGDFAEIAHKVTEEDIKMFGELSGDYNPLHFNEDWAKTTLFEGRIAHGLLSASFISTVIGMKLPGPGTIYLGQQMRFKRPVRIGDTITARAEVVKKDDDKHRLVLRTVCSNQNNEIVIDGEATVTIMKM